MKGDKRSYKQENTLSINMGRKSIYLFNLSDKDNPIELAFQQKYGDINTYTWFGDGYIMLAFNEGYFVVISTRMNITPILLNRCRHERNWSRALFL